MLNQSKNIFFLGIKGVAMANLAVILKKMGKNVTGCDIKEVFITDKLLLDNKINWIVRFDPDKFPKQTDLIVYSAAHGGTNNPLVIEAKNRNIRIISQAQLMGELMDQFETKIAVCGCHGKTTTSSLLVYTLNKLIQSPSYLVGTPFFSGYQGSDFKSKKFFVVEADEYGVNPPVDKTPKFHLLNPNYIIATNIDFDHPDVYKNVEETKKAFLKFFVNLDSRPCPQCFATRGRRVRGNDGREKKLFICVDDKNLMDVSKKLNKNQYITYGFSSDADYRIIDWKTNEKENADKRSKGSIQTSSANSRIRVWRCKRE